jgi:hypothetical protein
MPYEPFWLQKWLMQQAAPGMTLPLSPTDMFAPPPDQDPTQVAGASDYAKSYPQAQPPEPSIGGGPSDWYPQGGTQPPFEGMPYGGYDPNNDPTLKQHQPPAGFQGMAPTENPRNIPPFAIPDPPPSRGAPPWAHGRREEVNYDGGGSGLLSNALLGMSGATGSALLPGGAGGDTLGADTLEAGRRRQGQYMRNGDPMGDPTNTMSLMNPAIQDYSEGASLLGDTGGGGQDILRGGAGGAPADDGSNPSLFNRLFGGTGVGNAIGGLQGRGLGAALLNLSAGDTAGAARSLQTATELRQREAENQSEANYRDKLLKLREQELNKPDLTNEEKQAAAIFNPTTHPEEYKTLLTKLITPKDDHTQAWQHQLELGRLPGTKEFNDGMQTEINKAQTQIYTGDNNTQYGKPPPNSVWQLNEDGTVHTEPVEGMPGARRPVPVPLAGSEGDLALQGKKKLHGLLKRLGQDYVALDQVQGIPNVRRTPGANVGSSLSSSDLGRAGAKAAGTPAASIRSRIAAVTPGIIASIKDAAHLSAQQMNSNVELEFYRGMLGDDRTDFHANLAAIDNLDQQFLGGVGLLEEMGIPKEDIAMARDASEMVRQKALAYAKAHGAPTGYKEPEAFVKKYGKGVWNEMSKEEQEAYFQHPDLEGL